MLLSSCSIFEEAFMYRPIIFPTLQDKKWGYFDLGALALRDYPDASGPNFLLDYNFTAEWKKKITNDLEVDHIWGGYLEDRTHIWRGLYDAPVIIHLGVDYNAPTGTPISTPVNAEVVHVYPDKSEVNGWGGRVILKLDPSCKVAPYLIYGHLMQDTLPQVGDFFEAGQVVGLLAGPEENGGWVPHLHVQCIGEQFYYQYVKYLEEIDGYFLRNWGEDYFRSVAPDPTYLVGKDA
jgi:hypothetical protein